MKAFSHQFPVLLNVKSQLNRQSESPILTLGMRKETCISCDFVSVSTIRQAADSAGSLGNQDTYASYLGVT